MDWILIAKIVKRLVALGIFIWLVYTFAGEAKKKNRSRLGWIMIGLASFYGSYFIAAVGVLGVQILLASARAGGFEKIDRTAIPEMVASAILATIPIAFGVAWFVRRKLRGLAELPDLSELPELPAASDPNLIGRDQTYF